MIGQRVLIIIRPKKKKPSNFQWLHKPIQINGDNLNNVRRETSRTSWTKREISK